MCLMFAYVSNIYVSCQCDTNCAGHFTLDAHASRPVACYILFTYTDVIVSLCQLQHVKQMSSWRFQHSIARAAQHHVVTISCCAK